MTAQITPDCINCGACVPECPQDAISETDDIFVISADLCCECVGFFDEFACAAVCPVDCCLVCEQDAESQEALLAKAIKVHPDKQFGENYPSHFVEK